MTTNKTLITHISHLSVALYNCYSEGRYVVSKCSVTLCWVLLSWLSLCWVPLCWVPLYWMSFWKMYKNHSRTMSNSLNYEISLLCPQMLDQGTTVRQRQLNTQRCKYQRKGFLASLYSVSLYKVSWLRWTQWRSEQWQSVIFLRKRFWKEEWRKQTGARTIKLFTLVNNTALL
jgi:hypothetical protein